MTGSLWTFGGGENVSAAVLWHRTYHARAFMACKWCLVFIVAVRLSCLWAAECVSCGGRWYKAVCCLRLASAGQSTAGALIRVCMVHACHEVLPGRISAMLTQLVAPDVRDGGS